jgi:capsid protein
MVMEHLQPGEEPVGFQPNGTDEKFGDFEAAIVAVIAWANGIPPEILTLSFNSNYSASKAANNEFSLYLNVTRNDFGVSFCQPFYVEWLLAETLSGKIQAPGLLEAWRDYSNQYDVFGAWTSADWTGAIKPAIDQEKLVRAYSDMTDRAFITYDRASRELNGTKWSKNVQKIAREVKQLADAIAPLKEIEALTKPKQEPPSELKRPKGTVDSEDSTDSDSPDASQKKPTFRVIR